MLKTEHVGEDMDLDTRLMKTQRASTPNLGVYWGIPPTRSKSGQVTSTVKALYYGPLYYGQPPIMDNNKIPDL